jgi:hypothetical protein
LAQPVVRLMSPPLSSQCWFLFFFLFTDHSQVHQHTLRHMYLVCLTLWVVMCFPAKSADLQHPSS